MASDQPVSCVQAKDPPPEWLPSTCATPPLLVVSLLLNRFPLAIPAHVCGGKDVVTTFQPFSKVPRDNTGQPLPVHAGNGGAL